MSVRLVLLKIVKSKHENFVFPQLDDNHCVQKKEVDKMHKLKAPSGRELPTQSGEGECETYKSENLCEKQMFFRHAFSFRHAPRATSLPEGGLSFVHFDNRVYFPILCQRSEGNTKISCFL